MKKSAFEKEFGDKEIGFLIRKFESRNDRDALITTIRNSFREKGLKLVDASEKSLQQETWRNIKEFLDNCAFGVVIIDSFSPNDNNEFNPNIFLEIGYLLARGKNLLILIQNSLERKLPTDVKPFLYTTFDSQDIDSYSLKVKIHKWITNYKQQPGYLTVYFKKDFTDIDFISEFKKLIYSISDCEVINEKSINVGVDELKKLKIDYINGVRKVMFKTCSLEHAKIFMEDFTNGKYMYATRITNSILTCNVDSFPDSISEDPTNPGIYYLLNNESESLVYCTRVYIQGCEEEIDYAKSCFNRKETFNVEEIEIVVLKAKKSSGYVYCTNFKHSPASYPLKMYHGRKKDNFACLPLSTADILFMTIYAALPHAKELKNNTTFRENYLKAVDLHIDKVRYLIQESGTAIEYGLARNIKTIQVH